MSKYFKIIFTGDMQTGKTTLIEQYIFGSNNSIDSNSNSNLNYYSLKKNINDILLNIQIWDTNIYHKHLYLITSILILVFDLTNIESLNNIKKYFEYIKIHNIKSIILVGNKLDKNINKIELSKIYFIIDEIHKIKDNINIKYYETSGLKNINVNNLFEYIILECIYLDNIGINTSNNNQDAKYLKTLKGFHVIDTDNYINKNKININDDVDNNRYNSCRFCC